MASSFFDFSRHFGPSKKSASSICRLSAPASSGKSGRGKPAAGTATSPTVLEAKLEGILQQRRQRQRFFDSDLFADPAWDILLALALAELQFRRMSVGRLCDASNVPTTTALRWTKHLEEKGYVVRHPDRLDSRRTYLELSDSASGAMRLYLESLDGPQENSPTKSG